MLFIIGFAIMLGLIGLDQLSKALIVHFMAEGDSFTFIPHLLDISHVRNTGAGWGILNNYTWLLAIISFMAFVFICYLLKDFNWKKSKLYSISLVLLGAGAGGNLIDRVFRSDGVVDFITVTFIDFPSFNLADSYLTIGCIILAIFVLFFDKKTPKVVPDGADGGSEDAGV